MRFASTPARIILILILVFGVGIAHAIPPQNSDGNSAALSQDKESYLPGEPINFRGAHFAPGESISIFVSADASKGGITVQATADDSGSFTLTATMPNVDGYDPSDSDQPAPSLTATATGATSGVSAQSQFTVGHAATDGERILSMEKYWQHRVTYPTGKFNPDWVRKAAKQNNGIGKGIPRGKRRGQTTAIDLSGANAGLLGSPTLFSSPNNLSPTPMYSSSFVPLGPKPERMTGCTSCFDYGTTSGRVNDIVIDPTTTTNGSIVAYAATVGGGVWKTTNCCSSTTTWNVVTDDPLIATTAIDSLTIDPNNHSVIYAGTGDLNYGSFSMGSQGILKSTDAGQTWTVLGADIFGPAYDEPAGNFPQYDAVGKVRVDPNNSNNVMAGTKKGIFVSYDAGANWTGPCSIAFAGQRQDITGLDLSSVNGTTRIIAAVGVRGFATTVQYDLGSNGANGLYRAPMPAQGCPAFTLVSRNDNGFVFGPTASGAYAANAPLNAGSGNPYLSASQVNGSVGNQLGRIDIAVAPSDPNVIYAQVQSIVPNSNSGCGNANGCQLGAWVSTNGGDNWTFLTNSHGNALRACGNTGTQSNVVGSAGGGDYPQNWYDQGVAVDPNNPDRVIFNTFDTWLVTRTGTDWYNITCGYAGSSVNNHVTHVDHHAQAFVPGNSNILLIGDDGGIHGTANAGGVALNGTRPTWFNMDGGFNTIEFYSGDISGNFATSAAPMAAGGAQDNGPSAVTFNGPPTEPAQWQMGTGGDGFYARIDPVGTGTSLRVWLGNNSGGLARCISNCSTPPFSYPSKRGAWTGDLQSFILPFDLFHGGITGGDDCPPAGPSGGCGHLVAATTRVWETVTGNAANSNGTVTWYVTNNPSTQNLTKGTLGNRSFINQVKFAPKTEKVAIVGTNDGNVQFGFNMGAGTAGQATWINVTDNNSVLPNRPVLGIAIDPTTTTAPTGYAAVGGFDENTPTTPGHVFKVVCDVNCKTFTWSNRSGNLPNIPVDSVIVNPNFPQQVFAGTDFGLYYTDDITAASPVWQRFYNLPAVMIWDMQVDRGSTTLSLWTRGRGAWAWPLTIGPENPLPTDLAVAPVTGTNGATAQLSATLTSGGNAISGKTVSFALKGVNAGTAVTDNSGIATLTGDLAGIVPGTYPGGVTAHFEGDPIYYAPADGSNTLTVLYSVGNCVDGPGHTILAPISAAGTSTFKQGSTVPAKFRVCDSNGNSIGTPGVVASFRIINVSSGTSSTSTDLSVDSTTPDTAFRWDPTAQQWIYNINTKSLAAGNTYVFRIQLNDRSNIDFQFGLR